MLGYTPVNWKTFCSNGRGRSELERSASCIGHRQMHQRLRNDHHLSVDRETVRLKVMDPDGVEMRKKRRLKRWKYSSPGPNYLWHIDGYDKLKPYSFAIHGCIDGYSRRIMWLEVASTNKDAAVRADHFLECVQQMEGTARIVHADPGAENVNLEVLQKFKGQWSGQFCWREEFYRIEAWWAFLRNSETNWWMNFFKGMLEVLFYGRDSGRTRLNSTALEFASHPYAE
ncbi:hypothetical protein P5673_012435 [Acropora cervicornis]|uniref:Integrase core domain-containing protein n=1 Tax=Acropora cervicornis TaxID=6130 RepID=A0AAD9QMX1_ACRCE|nr:hypothetical protein P5673_012435 [Acropora cervicornis]